MNTEFETNFTVMPEHTNYMLPLIFGGAFFSKLDLCAACCVKRFLQESKCEAAVTHLAETKFMKPCYLGDIVFMKAEIIEARVKSITVKVTAEREKRNSLERDRVAEATFVFVSIEHANDISKKPDMLPYAPHGLTLE